jgi:putative glycosyltransferase
MELSVVTTLYYSAAFVEEFYERAGAAARRVTEDYEIVFVNDGSPDNSLDVALALHARDARVRVVDLSRNFGHHKAIMTGLAHARGRLVFLLDSDLEEEPELLDLFHARMAETGADVVYGVQARRKGHLMERASGAVFFKLFNLLSSHPIPANLITARLMRRRYVSALLRHEEREVVLSALWAITGFEQVAVPVTKHHKRTTTYNFARRVSNFVEAITSFSDKPLVYIFYLGCAIVAGAGAAAAYLVVRRAFFGELLQGWASLIVSVWLLGGLTIFCLGVIGIYLSKVFVEAKRRPYTIVREVYERGAEESARPAFGFGEAAVRAARAERT